MSSIKVKDFFNGRFFEIPKYQRGYAWEIQNIRDLFDDLMEAIDSNSTHYIGTIVLSKDSNKDETYYVVDGQQRITTITMIIKGLTDCLSDKDKYFYERFYLLEDSNYRLTPLNRDKEYFIALLNGELRNPENKSQRSMYNAMKEIKLRIDTIENKLDFLKAIEKLEVMEFVENSEGDAIRIFQTVNDRGKALSNTEKIKSLLIYFSNKYLQKKYDDKINDTFSNVFELYDDIKQAGENINITLFKNKEFNEDNIMRYHFIAYFNDNYDPTPGYILKYLKDVLTEFRTSQAYDKIESFISNYIQTLESFFMSLKNILTRANVNEKYYKIFSVLQLSATLYPLTVKLETLGKLDENYSINSQKSISVVDMLELIDVRVYKTRGTDPKAQIARFTYEIKNSTTVEKIINWLMWFNGYWMPKEQFMSALNSNIYGNRALNHIYISYCEYVSNSKFSIVDLKSISSSNPNIEHILAQTPDFNSTALGFSDDEDYINYEHRLGNLTLLEKSYNASIQNKIAIDKVETYDRSYFIMTNKVGTEISAKGHFKKGDVTDRTKVLAKYISEKWWCEIENTADVLNYSQTSIEEE
jgi:hypothetical protein